MQNKANGPSGLLALHILQNSGVQVKPATSVSSRELSDEDEVEGEAEITENTDPADAKRIRR